MDGSDRVKVSTRIARLATRQGARVATAESLTGGLVGARVTGIPGASDTFRGAVVSYASEVKFDVLGVPEGPVVSAEAAKAMAEGARRVLGADLLERGAVRKAGLLHLRHIGPPGAPRAPESGPP